MFRIVYNEQIRWYRIERRGLFGWSFVTDRRSGDYLNFEDFEAARAWVRAQRPSVKNALRRWKVVSDCQA